MTVGLPNSDALVHWMSQCWSKSNVRQRRRLDWSGPSAAGAEPVIANTDNSDIIIVVGGTKAPAQCAGQLRRIRGGHPKGAPSRARSFLLYKVMSNDSAHNTVTSVLNHRDLDTGQFRLGPADNDKVELNLDNLVLIATGIGIGFTNTIGDVESNRRVTALCNRYGVLRAKAVSAAAAQSQARPSA
ncbi:MAG TPA: hypothetical protein VGI79_04685 [Caulobacteraceae bacterium]